MIKKTLLATAVSLSLLGTTLVSIDGFARGAQGGGPGQRMSLLERLDSNGDGVLTIDEFGTSNAAKAERTFNYKDLDGDGVLSLEEFSVTGGRRGHGNLDNLDNLDEDALILCMEEILGYELPQRPDSASDFDAADNNADSSVDLDEFLAAGDFRAEDRFMEIDGEGDGEITSEEMDAYQTVQQERREARQTCVSEQLDTAAVLN